MRSLTPAQMRALESLSRGCGGEDSMLESLVGLGHARWVDGLGWQITASGRMALGEHKRSVAAAKCVTAAANRRVEEVRKVSRLLARRNTRMEDETARNIVARWTNGNAAVAKHLAAMTDAEVMAEHAQYGRWPIHRTLDIAYALELLNRVWDHEGEPDRAMQNRIAERAVGIYRENLALGISPAPAERRLP